MSNIENSVTQLRINRLTKTQFDGATGLSQNELYFEDPLFTGGKILATDSAGDIVETDQTPISIQPLTATDSITLADNVLYQGGEQTSLTVAVPANPTVGFICQITFKSGSTATTFTETAGTIYWNPRGDDVSFDGTLNQYVFVPDVNKVYTIIVHYNGFNFVAEVEGNDAV